MCDIATGIAVASLAIGAASSAMSFVGQQQQANAQNDYANENAHAAVEATLQQYSDTQARIAQEQAAAGQQTEQVNREAQARAATARVAVGEAGVSGLSVDALLGDAYGSAARRRDVIGTNLDYTVDQLQRSQLGIQAQGQNRISSVRTVAPPSGLQLGLGIAQAATSAGAAYYSLSNGTKYTKLGSGGAP
jgi:hypothetical protein